MLISCEVYICFFVLCCLFASLAKFITLMIQKEVAERLTAIPRTKDYGRLSIITQWCCEVQPLFTLPPSAFVPAPKVHSTVVQLRPRKDRAHTSFAALEKLSLSTRSEKILRFSICIIRK